MNAPKIQAIDDIRVLCGRDERVCGAIHYGSDAKGVSDEISDIDIIFFIENECLSFSFEELRARKKKSLDIYSATELSIKSWTGYGNAKFNRYV